jgi:hypothetical protein
MSMQTVSWCWHEGCSTCGKLLLVIAAFACVGPAQTVRQKIKLDDARKLVYEVLRDRDSRHQIEVSQVENRYDPVFMYFEATWPNPAGART